MKSLIKGLFASFLLLATLAGCVSGVPKTDTYTGSDGVVTSVATDREICERSCNADYNRCVDSGAAHRSISGNAPSELFGAKADCRADLKRCLPRCKTR